MVHFLPLILAGFSFGMLGALIVWSGFTLIYSPYLWLHLYRNTGEMYEQILYSVLFLLVALLLGFLSDREKKIQKEKQQMTRLASMGETISFISHEMKAQLVTIGGCTRQVRDKINNRKMQEKMDLVLKEITRMERLIKNMLDFAGPARVSLSSANLIPIVDEVIPVIENHSIYKGVKIDVDYPEKLPAVNCDPVKMKEVFLNLAFNAIEASPVGGTVRIQLWKENNYIINEISDEGDGVNEGDLNDIFSPFFTTKRGGTGLGLSISKKIVDAHHGKINIQKNQPSGIIIQIKLPVK
jgi:signal transduction histidine kinase